MTSITRNVTRSTHTMSLLDGEIVEESELGSLRRITAGNLPILKNLCIEWHFLTFFDQPTPADIGYRASASAYSLEVLSAAFNTHIEDLPTFPFTPTDPLIVGRVNPVD